METPIDTPSATILSFRKNWRRNRHVVEGSRSVLPNCRLYITPHPGQTRDEYEAFSSRVPFFPGAARTHEGLLGLMFRKSATITAPDGVTDIVNTITAQGYSLDDLAEEVASELLITNFVGLLVDSPVMPSGLSKAQAIASGYRPFVALYRAENIIGIDTAVVNNRQRVVRVRLYDNDDTIRELRLDDHVYTITIHKRNGSLFEITDVITPTKNGIPLDEVPFTLVSSKRSFEPTKAPLDDICDLNIAHYKASADQSICHYFSSAPIYNVFGAEGDASQYSVLPGSIWLFKLPEASTKILEYTGAAMGALRQAVLDIEDKMVAVGSRILASDKNVGEAAETLAIRRTAENATLASIARTISRKINDALNWVSHWLDLPEGSITYEANTDYNALPLSHFDLAARLALWQAGAISLDTFINMLVDSGDLPESFDAELDAQKIAEAMDAAPPVDTGPALEPLAPIVPAKPVTK